MTDAGRMNCDRIARPYRWIEYLVYGRALERCRFAYLHDIIGSRRVLMAGEGDGRFLAAFLRQSRESRVDYIDLSERMLAQARTRCTEGDQRRVSFIQGDIRDIEFSDNYDAIVTHFFLDCFSAEELTAVVTKLREAGRPGGTWIISDFHVVESGWMHIVSSILVRIMYTFFGVVTGLRTQSLVDYRPYLRASGMLAVKSRSWWRGMIVAEMWRE